MELKKVLIKTDTIRMKDLYKTIKIYYFHIRLED